MKVRYLRTDLDQINRLYRYSKMKNSPRTIRPLKYPDPNTYTVYLEKTSPNYYSPVTVKLQKYDTKSRDSSKSPYHQNQLSVSSRGRYNPNNSVRNYLDSIGNTYNNNDYNDPYKSISSSTNKNNFDVINGLKYTNASNYRNAGRAFSNKKRHNRFVSISPSSSYKVNYNNYDNRDENYPYYGRYNPHYNNRNNYSRNRSMYNNGSYRVRNIIPTYYYDELYLDDPKTRSPYSYYSRKSNRKYNNQIKKLRLSSNSNSMNSQRDHDRYTKDRILYSNNNNSNYINITPYNNRNLQTESSHFYDTYNSNNRQGRWIYVQNNSIQRPKKNSSSSRKYQDIYNNYPTYSNNNSYIPPPLIDIKVEELLILEEKFNEILRALNNYKDILRVGASNECLDFITFYYRSSLQNKFAYFFTIGNNRTIAQSAFNLLLYIILMTYHLSMNPQMLNRLILILLKIFQLSKLNLYLFYRQIQLYNGEEFSEKNEMYFRTYNYILKCNNVLNIDENELVQLINENCLSIVSNINIILDFYDTECNYFYSDFFEIFTNLSRLNEQDFYVYFYSNLYRPSPQQQYNYYNNNNDIELEYSNSSTARQNNNNANENNQLIINDYLKSRQNPPFIKTESNKKYTLVLDLDETLISVNKDPIDNTKLICKFRPGLISFLNDIKPYYELISFTTNTKDYSKMILSQIESNKKYFDYNLSREHSTLVGNDFVKDISKIGRNIKKIIIVDDLEDNFRLNYENGILISPYFGEELKNDNVLYELKNLLLMFYKIGYDDLRLALRNYKSEIKEKITLSFE